MEEVARNIVAVVVETAEPKEENIAVVEQAAIVAVDEYAVVQSVEIQTIEVDAVLVFHTNFALMAVGADIVAVVVVPVQQSAAVEALVVAKNRPIFAAVLHGADVAAAAAGEAAVASQTNLALSESDCYTSDPADIDATSLSSSAYQDSADLKIQQMFVFAK